MTSRQFAIIGQGGIAAVAGWLLQSAGHGFYSCGRRGFSQWEYLFDVGGSEQRVSALAPLADADYTSVHTVLVCVKAYDLAAAFDHLANFSQPVTVLPFVNGYVDDVLVHGAKSFPMHVMRQALATVGVSRTAAGFSLRSRGGKLQFGQFSGEGRPATLAEQTLCSLHHELDIAPRFEWRGDVQLLCRRKWLFNTAVNTLTASRRLVRNGDLLADLPTLAAVFAEAWSLAERLWGELPLARADAYAGMLKLIEDTADNENSMATDVRLGRKTEDAVLAGLSAKFPGAFPLLEGMSAALSRE